MTIKGFTVPLGESMQIRGGLRDAPSSPSGSEFVPPTGTNGFFARPIQVPGGILGIDFPIPGNAVTATATLVGPASGLKVNAGDASVRIPMKLKLSNPLIGPGCQIGSDSSPVNVNLIQGTTSPPAPNRPISGSGGRSSFPGNNTAIIEGGVNVDNSFAIPGASGCGINLGLINTLINAKLRLPSAAGNNTIIVRNDFALQFLVS